MDMNILTKNKSSKRYWLHVQWEYDWEQFVFGGLSNTSFNITDFLFLEFLKLVLPLFDIALSIEIFLFPNIRPIGFSCRSTRMSKNCRYVIYRIKRCNSPLKKHLLVSISTKMDGLNNCSLIITVTQKPVPCSTLTLQDRIDAKFPCPEFLQLPPSPAIAQSLISSKHSRIFS